MVALLRFLQHGEVFVELGLVLEGSAVDALELRIPLVAFVVGAGEIRETKSANVGGAHDVWAGAEIKEVAVAIEGDLFALLDRVRDDIELEFARLRSWTEGRQLAGFGERERLGARHNLSLKRMI